MLGIDVYSALDNGRFADPAGRLFQPRSGHSGGSHQETTCSGHGRGIDTVVSFAFKFMRCKAKIVDRVAREISFEPIKSCCEFLVEFYGQGPAQRACTFLFAKGQINLRWSVKSRL